MARPARSHDRLAAAERRAKADVARARDRARREPDHPSRNTRPRANPDVDDQAMSIGMERLWSVIAK